VDEDKFVNRSEYKTPSFELQDLRRGKRRPASGIGWDLEEGGAVLAKQQAILAKGV
jgi:hypothetical protein